MIVFLFGVGTGVALTFVALGGFLAKVTREAAHENRDWSGS